MRFNHLIQILLITCMLSLLSGCGTEPTAEQANATPPYHNPYFAEFILAITDTSRMVQPIPVTVPVDIAAARPGKQLFMSPELSVNNTISCATCHIITQGGDDNRPVSTGIFGRKGELNAPTVLNSGFNIAQFWDGRAATLEEQALGPLVMPNEMGMESPQAVADKLNANAKWRQLFIETFGEPATPEGIAFALAEFQRTLITPNSRFDRYLQGDQNALTPLEKEGWQAFQHLGCISCHQGINLGGGMFQKAGIFKAFNAQHSDKWLGRFNITGDPADKFVFKVPGLRNVAETAPYFHDGSIPTLELAVQIMIEKQTGHTAMAKDIQAIVAFLKTLSAPVKDLLQ